MLLLFITQTECFLSVAA